MSHVNLSTVMSAAAAVAMRVRPLRAAGAAPEKDEPQQRPSAWEYFKQACRLFAISVLVLSALLALTLVLIGGFLWASSLPTWLAVVVGILDAAFGFTVIFTASAVLADKYG